MVPKALRLPLIVLLLVLAAAWAVPARPVGSVSACKAPAAGAELVWESLTRQVAAGTGL
ncbi:hypothetical protein [Flaviaesturariibacter flavus]|uniref:hypothetical protein n=1 Tax=Flaviaesturariibacter flavus TaxID=2502780 RepID=UPI0014049A60|nr:hypothetical protein [Flaviaesturariibacter flavus]